MRESGSGSSMPFEGDASEERSQRLINSQQPSRRLNKLPEPRASQAIPLKRRDRRAEASERGRNTPTPLQPKLRSLDPRTSATGERQSNSRLPLKFSAQEGSREPQRDRRRSSTPSFFNRKPTAKPAQKSEAARRRRRTQFTPQASRPVSIKQPPRPRTRSEVALLYGTRLLILGVGVGVIAGTILSIWDPASRSTAGASQSEQTAPTTPVVEVPTLKLDQEILPLKSQLQALVAQQPQLTAGIMVVDLDTDAFLNLNAATALPCASTIKIPLLVAFFQDVDAGKIRLDESLTMRPELVATESGEMQYQPVGSQFTALDTVTKMITISDNTATNMVLDRLGGKEAVNRRFQSWGLTSTAVHNILPDVEGTNTSSAQDLVSLLGLVSNGKLLSMRSRDRVLDIMRHTITNSLLPSGLGEGATIAHKTGNIGTMTGDIGLVDMPSGKRYLIGAMVKRPRNDERGIELIRQVSRLTYQHFSQPAASAPRTADPEQVNQAPSEVPQGVTQPKLKVAQP